MLRGARILNQDPAKEVEGYLKVYKKGRNSDLIKKRNTVILFRYYMYKAFAKWNYEKIIETVSEEVYLSHRTVTDILTSNVDELKKITAEQPKLCALSKMFPHYDWSIKALVSH